MVPVIVILYVPTWLYELVYHEITLVVILNEIKDVKVSPDGGVTAIE
jgi:hypothetical protein